MRPLDSIFTMVIGAPGAVDAMPKARRARSKRPGECRPNKYRPHQGLQERARRLGKPVDRGLYA